MRHRLRPGLTPAAARIERHGFWRLKPAGRGPTLMGGGLLLFSRAAIFPLAYKFSEGAGSVVTLVTLPGAHLNDQAFGKSDAAAVAAVPATFPGR